MWCADQWKDYELLDTSDGERLERWGKYILIRPDPQIIWKNTAAHPAWKRADAIYRRSSNGGGGWIKNKRVDLYYPTMREVNQFGIHEATIYFLNAE